MSNKNFTLTYDELLLLLKEAYRNGYSTYEMTAAGLEPYDDDGYARWVLLGMKNNKQRKEIIKKWEESGLLDGLTEMDKDHPMLKVLEANGKQGINELPDVKPMMEKNKQEELDNTDKKLHISDVMRSLFLKCLDECYTEANIDGYHGNDNKEYVINEILQKYFS